MINIISNNNIIILILDTELNIAFRNSIWVSNFINLCNKSNLFVYIFTHEKYNNKNENFARNVINCNLFEIIFFTDYKILIGELENIYTEYYNKIENIIIENNTILENINENWFLLEKISIIDFDKNMINILRFKNKYKKLLVWTNKIKDEYISLGIDSDKIDIIRIKLIKYNFNTEINIIERSNFIKLIYVGTLCENQNILNIIQNFKIIHNIRKNVMLKIIYSKIEGNEEFKNKINEIIKNGENGITFLYNLSHKETCFHIATSDIGICWKNDEKDNLSFKKKEYIMYEIICLELLDINSIESILKFDKKKIFALRKNKNHFIKKICDNLEKKITNAKKYLISGMFDEFTKTSFENYFDIADFEINDDYLVLIEKFANIKFFFIETCWKFKNISIAKFLQEQNNNFANVQIFLNNLKKISEELEFKIIIWNKEDPVHYDVFSYLTEYTKYYFTSDINMIPKYKIDYNKEINCIGFFIDPYIHNPIGNYDVFDSCFAGRVYPNIKKRFEDSNLLLETCLNSGLDLIIFDRCPKKNKSKSFKYYDEFKDYVYDRLEYLKLMEIYKYFKIIINLNTVQNSNTMFARRVYEAVGFKKNIISNYSDGVKNNFKNVFIYEGNNINELNKYLNFIDKKQVINEYLKHIDWRNTHLTNSFASNINYILSKCEFDNYDELKLKTVWDISIIIFYTSTYHKKKIENKIKFTNNYKLIYIKNTKEIKNYKNLFNEYEYIVFLSENNAYDYYYIIDNLILIEYSEYNIITKPTSIDLEYQIKKYNQVELYSTIIKTCEKFKIENDFLKFNDDVDILHSDRFGFVRNLNKLENFKLDGYKIIYNKSNTSLIKYDNMEETNFLYYDNIEVKIDKCINILELNKINNRNFYFLNNCSVNFI